MHYFGVVDFRRVTLYMYILTQGSQFTNSDYNYRLCLSKCLLDFVMVLYPHKLPLHQKKKKKINLTINVCLFFVRGGGGGGASVTQ